MLLCFETIWSPFCENRQRTCARDTHKNVLLLLLRRIFFLFVLFFSFSFSFLNNTKRKETYLIGACFCFGWFDRHVHSLTCLNELTSPNQSTLLVYFYYYCFFEKKKKTNEINSKGILACLDGFMNIAMEQAEEYVGGQRKSQYADVFLRGNNVCHVRLAQ